MVIWEETATKVFCIYTISFKKDYRPQKAFTQLWFSDYLISTNVMEPTSRSHLHIPIGS